MEIAKLGKAASSSPSSLVWDCGSSLYDSFELNSFKRQLDSAITSSSRSLSMPHLSHRAPPPPPPVKKPSKLSRSLRKLLRSVFRQKPIPDSGGFQARGQGRPDSVPEARLYALLEDEASSLSSIPEVDEFGGFSPEISSFVTRTASERFTAANSIVISCA